jgi:hypothetical protein
LPTCRPCAASTPARSCASSPALPTFWTRPCRWRRTPEK